MLDCFQADAALGTVSDMDTGVAIQGTAGYRVGRSLPFRTSRMASCAAGVR